MEGWMDGQVDGGMDGWTGRWVERWLNGCEYINLKRRSALKKMKLVRIGFSRRKHLL
jgi:hypothetical protein